ncbi:hypothetical protein FBGL_14340 [Flavobacterium glycines]|uniref:Uncharacterized protein n=1 Tax=Flavobacterium glycines TaxID=551990 RepID=A0A1B9DGG6_9FLAO|nr:hypothetical protein FBGL_14340 [Flavobacterium glycines]
MKYKTHTILTILIGLFCVVTNLYWFFNQDIQPKIFMRINIWTAFLLFLVIQLPTIQQQLKNEK